jgi:ABC-2 type transport system permease protein
MKSWPKGIEAQNLSVKTDDGVSQKIIFPFALVVFGDKSIPVKLLQSQSNMNLSPDEV